MHRVISGDHYIYKSNFSMAFFRKNEWIFTNRQSLFVLAVAFILVHLLLYFQIGIVTSLEAEKYIAQGQILYQKGILSESKYYFYLPVILLIWFCKLLHLPLGTVVAIQIIFSAIAQYCFYRLALTLSGSLKKAFIVSFLLILFLPLQSWNFFLYTDSLFISASLIYTCILFRYRLLNIRHTGFILLSLILLLFFRPHALLFIPPTILYLLFRSQPSRLRWTAAIFCVLLLSGMYLFMNTIFTGGSDMDALKPFVQEHIICFVPLKPEGASLVLIHSGNPLKDLFYYILHNPGHYLRLSCLRLLSFFNMTRPYYGAAHNVYLLLYMIPVYLFTIAGLKRSIKRMAAFAIFLLALLILYPFGATFQCDDWHSRFTMVVFPYFILLGVLGVFNIFEKKEKRQLV